MLQSFLSQNRGSLIANLNMQPLMPSQYQLRKPCCQLPLNKNQTIQEVDKALSKSPTYKRKKIFQPIILQSQETGKFPEMHLTQSTVETYKAPLEEQKLQQANVAKKKAKASKQNGLFLAKGKLGFQQSPRSTMQTLPSQKQILQKFNQVKNENSSSTSISFKKHNQPERSKVLHQSQESECSLKVDQGRAEIFTFNSEGTISFQYSASIGKSNSKSESLINVGSPKNTSKQVQRQISP